MNTLDVDINPLKTSLKKRNTFTTINKAMSGADDGSSSGRHGADTSNMDSLLFNGDVHTHAMMTLASQQQQQQQQTSSSASPRRGHHHQNNNGGHRHHLTSTTHRSSARSLKGGSSTLSQLRPQLSRFPSETDPTGRCIRLKDTPAPHQHLLTSTPTHLYQQAPQSVPHLLNPLSTHHIIPSSSSVTPPSTFGAELGVFNEDGTEAPETAMLPSGTEDILPGGGSSTYGGGGSMVYDDDHPEHPNQNSHNDGDDYPAATAGMVMGGSSSGLGVRVSSSGGMRKASSIRLGNYASPVRASGDNTRMTRHAARLHARTLVAGVTCTPNFAAHFAHGDEGEEGGRHRPTTGPLVGGGSTIAGGRIPRGIGVQNSFTFTHYASAVDGSSNPTTTSTTAASSQKSKKQGGAASATATSTAVSSRVDDETILRLQNKALERHLFDIRDMTRLIATRREELLQSSDEDGDDSAVGGGGGVRLGRRNHRYLPEEGEINSIDASSTTLTDDEEDGEFYGEGSEYTDSEEWERCSTSAAPQVVVDTVNNQVSGMRVTTPDPTNAPLIDVGTAIVTTSDDGVAYADDFEEASQFGGGGGNPTTLLATSQQQSTSLFNSRSITQQELSMFDPDPADIAASDVVSRQQQRKREAAARRGSTSTSQHGSVLTPPISQAGDDSGVVGDEDVSEVIHIPNSVPHNNNNNINSTTTNDDQHEGSTSWRPSFLPQATTTTEVAGVAPHSPVSLTSRPSGSLPRRSFQAATAAIALRNGTGRRSLRPREVPPPKLPDAKGCGAVVDASSGSFSYFHYLDKLNHHHRRQTAKRRELQGLKDSGSPLTSEERKQLQLLTAIHEEEYHIRRAAAEHVAELSRKREDEELARRAEETFAFSHDCFGGDVAAAMAASSSTSATPDTSRTHHHTNNNNNVKMSPRKSVDTEIDGNPLICIAPLGAIKAESTYGGNNSTHSLNELSTPTNNNHNTRTISGNGGGVYHVSSSRSARKVSLTDDNDNPFTTTITRSHSNNTKDDDLEKEVQDRLVVQRMMRREVRKSILHTHDGADLFAGQKRGGGGGGAAVSTASLPSSPSRSAAPNRRLSGGLSASPSLLPTSGISPTASEGFFPRRRRAGENGSGSGVALVPSPSSSSVTGVGFRTTTSVIIDAPDAPDANPYLFNTMNGGRSRTFTDDGGDIGSQGSHVHRVDSGGSLSEECSGDIRNFTAPNNNGGGGGANNPAVVSSSSTSGFHVQEGPSETALRLEADSILADCADLLEERRQRSLAEFLTKKRRAAEIQLKAALERKGITSSSPPGGAVVGSMAGSRSGMMSRSQAADDSFAMMRGASSSKNVRSPSPTSHNRTSTATVSRSPHRGPSLSRGGANTVPPPLGTGTPVFVSERKGGIHGTMKQVSTGDISGTARASLTASREALLRSPYPFTPSSLVRCDNVSYEESTSIHRRRPSKYYGASPTTTRGYTSHHISKIARGLPTFRRSSAGGADSGSPTVNVSHEVQPSTNLLFLRQRLAKLDGGH